MEAETRALLGTIKCRIVSENLSEIYHYYDYHIFVSALKHIIECNPYIRRAMEIAASDSDLSINNVFVLYEVINIEFFVISNSIIGHITNLHKQRASGQIDARTYFDFVREISSKKGLLENLCKESARRITDCQNTFRVVAEGEKPIIVYEY